MKVVVKQKGNFNRTERYLKRARQMFERIDWDKYGKMGVNALEQTTPVDSGMTAASWSYEVVRSDGRIELMFSNSNLAEGWCPIAIILQVGHATRNGGWVEGRDYINPAIQPIFDEIAYSAWKEATKV